MIHFEVGFAVPSCDRRTWIGQICAIGLLLGLPACADLGTSACDPLCPDRSGPDAAGSGADGGAFTSTDAGASDAAPAPQVDAGATSETDVLGGAACFNAADDDGNGFTDCLDSACGASAYCCIGETSAGCCNAPEAAEHVAFEPCAGTDPLACGPGMRAFGGPTPRLESGGMVPYGDELSDSGLVLAAELDPTRDRITLSAVLAAPPEGCGATGCVDVVAVGLGSDPQSGFLRVRPDVAVVVRTARHDVALVVAGEVLQAWPLMTGAPQRYELLLSPDGTVELRREGASLATAAFTPRPHRRVLVYGRTQNHTGETLPGRAMDVTALVSRCDVPSALARAASSELPWDGAGPSAVREGEEILLAFEHADAIHLARWSETAGWNLSGGDLARPALPADAEERFTDPSLVRESESYTLYLTRHFGSERAIVRAEGLAGFEERFAIPTPVTFAGGAELVPLRAPSVVDFQGARWMAATTELADGPRIVLLKLVDGAFEPALGTIERSIIARPSGTLGAFDEQAVDEPDLSVDGHGLLRLHYAGRSGARWSIGVRVSGDGLAWRDITGGSRVLGPGVDFDAFGVRAPSAVFADGVVDLFYTADDGAVRAIGRATGTAR